MLNSEIIQRVKSLYSKGVQSDDSRLTSRHIYNKLLSVRSRLMSQKVNKNQLLSQWSYQLLPCVELIKAPLHECPCLPDSKCVILRSKYRLPSPIPSISKDVIQYVTTLDGLTKFDRTTFENEKYSKGNKFTSKDSNYYIKDGYLYITHKKSLEVVTLSGLFNDPLEAMYFPSYCEDNCKDCKDCESNLDKHFYIDSDLLEPLIEITLGELIEMFSQMREDQTNDSRDNLIQESKS